MKTIACIPGTWKDRKEFVQRIVSATDGAFLAAGTVLMKVGGPSIEFELCPRDERMRSAFSFADRGQMAGEDLDAIDGHGMVVYLLTDKNGLDHLHELHNAIAVCFVAGGLGVKFENSGTAHTATMWKGYRFHENTLSLLNAHVMLIVDDDFYFTCGMHIFGLPDVAVAKDHPHGGYLLTEFNHYYLFESPVFKDGQTFSPDKGSPKMRLSIRDDFLYKDQGSFENPFGRIELKRIQS